MYMEAKYEDEHSNIGASSRMTVNAWFDFWLHEIKENKKFEQAFKIG